MFLKVLYGLSVISGFSFNNFQNSMRNDNTKTYITANAHSAKCIAVKTPFNNRIAMNERQVSWGSLTASIENHNNEILFPAKDIPLKEAPKPNGYCFRDEKDKDKVTASNSGV